MRVAAVFIGLEPDVGGSYTFGGSLYRALREAEPDSRHDFVAYSVGGHPPPGVIGLPATRAANYGNWAIKQARIVQDRVGARRVGPQTWLERSLDEQQVDLVWFAMNHTEETNRPFIFTVLDIEHRRQPWFPEVSRDGEWKRREDYFARWIPQATRVIVPNEAGAEQVERYYRVERERIMCLPHFVPDFARRAADEGLEGDRAALERHGIEGRYLLYPAQLWAHKNHATLFDALVELDGYRLVLVGRDYGQREALDGLAAELGISDRVHVLGFVEEDELLALYRNAHALTYASLFGPENLPPLEAMALGCPVVAADVPGAEEQMGDAAIRVPPTDAQAFAAAVRRLEDEGERARLVDAGRERAAGYSPARYVSGVLDFLDRFEHHRRGWR